MIAAQKRYYPSPEKRGKRTRKARGMYTQRRKVGEGESETRTILTRLFLFPGRRGPVDPTVCGHLDWIPDARERHPLAEVIVTSGVW